MGRKRRRSPEPFLVFFGPITRKEVEVRRKLGLFENPDKNINMDDLDSDFWDYYYADENDENLNLTAGVRNSPKTPKLVENTLHLSLLNEKHCWENEILSSKKVRLSKSDDSENAPGILTERITNETKNPETSVRPICVTRSSKIHAQNDSYLSENDSINLSIPMDTTSCHLSNISSSDVNHFHPVNVDMVESNDVSQISTTPAKAMIKNLKPPGRSSRRLSKIRRSGVSIDIVESNDDHQIPASPENAMIIISKPPGRSSRRLKKSRISDVNLSAVSTDMIESNNDQVQTTPESAMIENSKPPGRSSRRLNETKMSEVHHTSEVSADVVGSDDDHQIPALPENAMIENSKPPGKSSRRLSKSRISDVNLSAVSTDMIESNNDQVQTSPESAMIENSKPPGRSSRRLSKSRTSDVNLSAVSTDMIESNYDHQVQTTPENAMIGNSKPPGRSSQRLSKTRISDVNLSAVSTCMVESNNDHQVQTSPENAMIENSKPPGRSSRRLSKSRISDVSAVSTDMVESNNDHQVQTTPENAMIENSKPPERSSRRLSKTRISDLNLSAVSTDMVESNNDQVQTTPKNAVIENSKPPGRSSRRLSKTRMSEVNHASEVSADIVGSSDNHQTPTTPENVMIENSIPPERSSRRLSKAHSSDVIHPSATADMIESNVDQQIPAIPQAMFNRSLTFVSRSSNFPHSSSNCVSSSIKKNSKIPVSSKCRDKILQNIRNAGILKTPRTGTPQLRKMSSIPVSAPKLLSRASNVNTTLTPRGTKTPLAQQSGLSANKNISSKPWLRKSAVTTPINKRTPLVTSAFNSSANNKAPFSAKQPTSVQNTPLSAIKRVCKTPQLKKGPSDTPLSTLKTLYRTPKPQSLDTPDTPLSAVRRIYKTPNFKPTDVFNVGSTKHANGNRTVPSTPVGTSRTPIFKSYNSEKKDVISKITSSKSSLMTKSCFVKKKSTVETPKKDDHEVNVVASTSKFYNDSVSSQSMAKKSNSGIKPPKNYHASLRLSSKTPMAYANEGLRRKRLTPKLGSLGKSHRLTPSNKKSSTDSFGTPDSFEVSKNYSFTPDAPKVKPNFLKAPKLLVNGKEINDVKWTNKLNPKKVVLAKRPNYMYSPTLLNKNPK